MSRKESHIKNITESILIPENKPSEIYANGRVKVYTWATIIDLPKLNTHIIISKHDPFEFNKGGEVSEILVRKQHHKRESVFKLGDHINADAYEYEVWDNQGDLIGFAEGKRLDLYVASLFYSDPKITEQIRGCGMDAHIKDALDFAIISAGYKKHPK